MSLLVSMSLLMKKISVGLHTHAIRIKRLATVYQTLPFFGKHNRRIQNFKNLKRGYSYVSDLQILRCQKLIIPLPGGMRYWCIYFIHLVSLDGPNRWEGLSHAFILSSHLLGFSLYFCYWSGIMEYLPSFSTHKKKKRLLQILICCCSSLSLSHLSLIIQLTTFYQFHLEPKPKQ